MTDDERRKYNRDYYASRREETCAYRRERYRNPLPQNKEYTKRKFVLKTRICLVCGQEYTPTGTTQKSCAECLSPGHRERKSAYDKAYIVGHYKEKIARDRRYHAEHREEENLRSTNYSAAHPEKRAAINRKHCAKHRTLGFTPLNTWFDGCEGHHVDAEQVIYMPETLHRSIYHNQHTGQGMAKINAIAYNYLFKLEVGATALADYARRVNEPELPAQVARLWN